MAKTPSANLSTSNSAQLRARAELALRFAQRRIRKMEITKGARFEAARRHKFSARSSVYAISILSLFIFGFSVYIIVYPNIDQFSLSYFSGVNLILSFFVIAFTLMQSGKRHEVRSELFLKCAQEIDGVYTFLSRDIEQRKVVVRAFASETDAELHEIIDGIFEDLSRADTDYQSVLNSFSDNHSEFDYNIYCFNTHMNPKNAIVGDTFIGALQSIPKWIYRLLQQYWWKWRHFWYVRNNIVFAVAIPAVAVFWMDSFRAVISLMSATS